MVFERGQNYPTQWVTHPLMPLDTSGLTFQHVADITIWRIVKIDTQHTPSRPIRAGHTHSLQISPADYLIISGNLAIISYI